MTKTDRESVERLARDCYDASRIMYECNDFPTGQDILKNASATLLALRATLDEAEAEQNFWRQAAAKGSIYTQADLDRAAQEARAVALQEAADLVWKRSGPTLRKEVKALLDTPAAEALAARVERVRAEEREACAKVAEGHRDAGLMVKRMCLSIAAAIRARGET